MHTKDLFIEEALVADPARSARGESVTAIGIHLGIGTPTLYRVLSSRAGWA